MSIPFFFFSFLGLSFLLLVDWEIGGIGTYGVSWLTLVVVAV